MCMKLIIYLQWHGFSVSKLSTRKCALNYGDWKRGPEGAGNEMATFMNNL